MKIFYKKVSNYKYKLAEEYTVKINIFPPKKLSLPENNPLVILDTAGRLTIKKCYAWDGPSGPSVDTKNFMRGSLVHDVLYQLMRAGKLDQSCREQADIILRDICREDGMSRFRSWYIFKTVRHFAGFAAERSNAEEIIYIAP